MIPVRYDISLYVALRRHRALARPVTMSVPNACHRPIRRATTVGYAFMEVTMTRLSTIAAIPALAVSLALAGPALAQPAAGQQAGGPPQAAAAAPAQRMVTGRELMTPQERAGFRVDMQQAAPEQRQQLWEQKCAELAQRATQRGAVLAESGSRPGVTAGEGRRSGRGEDGGSWVSRIMRSAPRAP